MALFILQFHTLKIFSLTLTFLMSGFFFFFFFGYSSLFGLSNLSISLIQMSVTLPLLALQLIFASLIFHPPLAPIELKIFAFLLLACQLATINLSLAIALNH